MDKALIIGASGGIGAALARALAGRGVAVTGLSRSGDGLDLRDPAGIMAELASCRATWPHHYIRLTAFDSSAGTESIVMAFIVNRPQVEPGFKLLRHEVEGRTVRYSIESYAVQAQPEGARYTPAN